MALQKLFLELDNCLTTQCLLLLHSNMQKLDIVRLDHMVVLIL